MDQNPEENPGWPLREIIVQTGVQRLRPVFLTTFTTGFGLLPLAMGISIDLLGAEIEIGGPIASQWAGLASTIVFWSFVCYDFNLNSDSCHAGSAAEIKNNASWRPQVTP